MINPFREYFTEGQRFDYINVLMIVVSINDPKEFPPEFGDILKPCGTMICDYVNARGEILTKEFQEYHIPALIK